MQAFGAGAFALRLPAFLGFLLMQVCLFFFVRNLAGDRAGFVAAAFPALTATLFYSVEGRPYGLMLGLYALALWCWQVASRRERNRGFALLGLALAIAATINAHYFGVLLLVPICASEFIRIIVRRRVDWPMVAAIALGIAGFAGTMPFLNAAAEFKKNYYNGGAISLHDITRAYRSIVINYTWMSLQTQHWIAIALVVFAAALLAGCIWRMTGRKVRIPAPEWVALLTLAALPFCGFLLAKYVTHSIEVRYVLSAVVAISAMVAIVVAPWLRRDWLFAIVLVLLGAGIVGAGALRIRAEQQKTEARMASLEFLPEVKAALAANPDGRLYIQDMGAFEEDRYYEPDPDIQARMTLVYSAENELKFNRHDTMALTAMHLQHFTWLPIVSYEALKATPGEHLFVLSHTGWDWTDEAFAADGATVRPVDRAMAGDVAAVQFR
jgi:4-amino-4-deoxy-L-arabinose transferase-like glycosyltransferase